MIDPYTAGKMVQHTQGELARARGHRNWKRLFIDHTRKADR